MFDEPPIKWTRLLTQVSKLLKNGPPDLADEPLASQQEVFRAVFGSQQNIAASRVFNAVLALEEAERFEDACFYNWYLSFAETEDVDRTSALAQEITKHFGLPQGAALWLEHACSAVPDWCGLLESGPWTEEPLALFVADCLRPHLSAPESVDTVLLMQQTFRDLLRKRRNELSTNFQPNVVLLVEGVTESILIPRIAQLLNAKLVGMAIIACGGANQLLRRYIGLIDVTPLPVFCLIDRDADEPIATIRQLLRTEKDSLHVWQEGEIEDALGMEILLRYLNLFLSETGASAPISLRDMETAGKNRTVDLDRVWRARGLGDFDKVGFARYVAEHISADEIPPQMRQLVANLKTLAGAQDNERR